ncbi:MAG: hypothetical protein ACRDU5_15980 [Mycobacterium sp.]
MTRRTPDCTNAFRDGRLKKANEFHEGAVVIADDLPNAAVDLLVDAGIAAADVICCARLGVHATGENHYEAAALLKQAEGNMEKYLRTLLNLKTKVAYTHQPATIDERKKASRAAEALVEAARRISAGQ